MIRYALKCENEHGFESWFQTGSAFDSVRDAGMLECPVCGSNVVEKAIMAPRVSTDKKADAEPAAPGADETPSTDVPVLRPNPEVVKAIETLRREVEKQSDYVGKSFASEARKIHDGEAPERAIYGEAAPKEAKALIEDGIPIVPLPFRGGKRN